MADTEKRSSGDIKESPQPNPRRVHAGRMNRLKRKGLTPGGREKLRQAALKTKPWRFTRGPKTPEGKAKSALNGKKRQLGPRSVREIRADLAGLRDLLREMREGCKVAEDATA
jgi:hypothetical protein